MPALLDSMVTSLIESSNRPLTAYEISRLSVDRGSAVSPTQVYRVLDRLAAQGSIQRIELLAAYIATHGARTGFLVCRCCSAVTTFPVSALVAAVDRLCGAVGFNPSHSLFEMTGLCADCSEKQDTGAGKPGKAQSIMRNMKSLIALVTTAGAFALAMPADAEERRPDALYDRTGRNIGTVALTDAPKGVLLRIMCAACRPAGTACLSMRRWGVPEVGATTKIHMLADALGRPLRFRITAGQAHDITAAQPLLEG